MKILALDFDGVISDSAREAFAVALRTHPDQVPHSPFAGREQDAALYGAFLEAMPLGNRAEDYFVVLEALRRSVPLPDQTAYDAFKAGLDPEALRSFHRRFYWHREAWATADLDGWIATMRPYPRLPEWLRARSGDVVLGIATAKDRGSVARLLDAYGLADLFAAERIHDKDTGVSKRAHVEALARDQGVAPADVTFVDDKVNHLNDVAATGARCGLAAWGYNGVRERVEAERAGHLVLELDRLDEALFP